ncbi:MAG: hypothetical protein J6C97_04550 [Clostridia bacterium]|nr:hypothetical protein [Clostridia bacterium]
MSWDIINYTFSSCNKSVTIQMTQKQYNLYQARAKRSFFKLTPMQKVLNLIEKATNTKELENIAKKYDICDVCRVDKLHLQGVKCLLSSIVKMLYKYPRLRANTCFVGSHQELRKILMAFGMGNKELLKEFGLQFVLDPISARKIALINLDNVQDLIRHSDSFIATAVSAFGLFDSILIDQEDYNPKKYASLVSDILYSEQSGFHPKNCGTPESIIFHELGHLIDYLCNISSCAEFARLYRGYSALKVKRELSEYATVSPQEFLAEAFAEYESSNTPREIARQVGQLIQQKYNSYR